MLRTVTSHLSIDVREPADLFLAVAVADGSWDRSDVLTVRHDDGPLDVSEIKTPHGGRVHRVRAPAGRVVVDYRATVTGRAGEPPVEEADLVEYLRPSRYADSDRLYAFARDQFRGVAADDLLAAVVSWVGQHLTYLSGSSLPTDGASDTLLKRRGVCRDFAHLVVAMLRAHDVPARVASVYAPGLQPMDFHAVAEAYVAGSWRVVDATGLAPRATFVRIATGRDTTDTAFLSSYGGRVLLRAMTVTAAVEGERPTDDGSALVTLR